MKFWRSWLLVCAICVLLTAAARADVKIVSDVTAQGQMMRPAGQPARQTVTTYYKDGKVRTEIAGKIVIYDGDKLIQLDPKRKTYTVNALQTMAARMQPMMAQMRFDTGGSVTPGGETRTIAGVPAQNYRVALSVRMSLRTQEGAPSTQMPSGPLMTLRIEGEQWASDAIALPADAQRLTATALLHLMAVLPPDMKPLLDKMATIRGVPLSGRMTLTMTPAQGMAGAAQQPITATTVVETRSIRRETLPTALFAVPAGYRKVEPGPETPGGPGGFPGG